MKRACMLLVPALFLLALATGCEDEESSKPTFTRVRVTPACGVVPLEVEGYAILSGGNESGSPLGGNNNLEIKWDFDDGGTGNTTIAYHKYTVADDYDVVVTGRDPDGNTPSATFQVTVIPDSLVMVAGSDFPVDGNDIANVTTADTVRFNMEVSSCDIDYPTVPGDSVKVEFQWTIRSDSDTTRYHVVAPEFQFTTPGSYEVDVSVFYPFWAVLRQQTLLFNVTDP